MLFTLKAVFKLAGGAYGGTLLEQGIAKVTGGPEVHVEALIADDPLTCFSAHLDSGVRMVGYLGGKASLWYGLDTGLEVMSEALEWATAECGQPYNLLGAIISGLKFGTRFTLEPLFCSQAFAEVFNRCKGPGIYGQPNPHVLSELLLSYGAKRMDQLPAELFVPKNEFI
jgi:hypothetical protein